MAETIIRHTTDERSAILQRLLSLRIEGPGAAELIAKAKRLSEPVRIVVDDDTPGGVQLLDVRVTREAGDQGGGETSL